MPQPLNLTGGGSGTLLVRRQTRTLLHAYPGGVVLKVELLLCVPGQRSHPGMEVCQTPVLKSRTEASIRVPRMFKSHV
jgi:hypothetical protein